MKFLRFVNGGIYFHKFGRAFVQGFGNSTYQVFFPVILMKIAVNILVKDQVARLVSEKRGDNKNSQRLLSYEPRVLEERLQSINSNGKYFLVTLN